jgi:asparagine synthase (glutamine-hydrolysing)
LKRAAREAVPAGARTRKKQPYRAPDVNAFFPLGKASEPYVAELTEAESVRRDGIFNPAAVTKLCAKAKNGTALGIKDNMAFTAILSTELWLKEFIDSGYPQARRVSERTNLRRRINNLQTCLCP